MNAAFLPAGIRFELCRDISSIDNSQYLETNIADFDAFTQDQWLANVINIFFIPELDSNSGIGLCGVSSFPSGETKRRILMANSCVSNGSTFIHEMGHFFNLYHTHSTSMGEEYVNGLNCSWRGDGFCDTPADPRLSSNTVSNCIYFGTATDPNGSQYTPDVRNIMSYAPKVCRDNFSEEQIAAMSLCAQTANNYIYDSCSLPDYSASTIVSEIRIDSYEDYNFELSLNEISGFAPDEEILLKVRLSQTEDNFHAPVEEFSFNFYENVAQSISFSFPVDNTLLSARFVNVWIDAEEGVQELDENNNKLSLPIKIELPYKNIIFPNPVLDNAQILMNNSFVGTGTYTVHSTGGHLVMEGVFVKSTDFTLFELGMSSLASGLYLLSFDSGEHERETLKVIKQ